jgi:hypothetical protein
VKRNKGFVRLTDSTRTRKHKREVKTKRSESKRLAAFFLGICEMLAKLMISPGF